MNRTLVVSIIGRPNVGKSTIYNRLMGRMNKVITHDMPGVTRDRHYGIMNLTEQDHTKPCDVILIDTGGFYPERIDERTLARQKKNELPSFFNLMRDHAKIAIEESDLVLFIVDAKEGLLPFDQSIFDIIRSKQREAWVIVNKADSQKIEDESSEFYALGVKEGNLFFISAEHARGILDFKMALHQKAIDFSYKAAQAGTLQKGITPKLEVVGKLAIIGVPNAGKSTLLNQLLGSERALVSDIPGTTVDPIEGFFELYMGPEVERISGDEVREAPSHETHLLIDQYEDFRKNNPDLVVKMDKNFEDEGDLIPQNADEAVEEVPLNFDENEIVEEEDKERFYRSVHVIDTAGIRRAKSIESEVEEQSVYRALRSITESDVVVYMVDATKGLGHQDRRLIDLALEKGKSVIVGLNKFDLMKEKLKTRKDIKEWMLDLRAYVPWLSYCDMIPMSALEKEGFKRLKNALRHTFMIRRMKLPTGELNKTLFELMDRHTTKVEGGRVARLKIKYATMIKSSPPTILLFCNRSMGIPDAYIRYLQSGIRAHFALANTPIHLIFRSGNDLEKRMKKVQR